MTLLGDVARWFADPAHYQGSDAVQTRIFEHLEVSGLAVLAGLLVALPIGLYLGHTGRFGFVAVNLADVPRAHPACGPADPHQRVRRGARRRSRRDRGRPRDGPR